MPQTAPATRRLPKRLRFFYCSTVPDRDIMRVESSLLSPRQLVLRRRRSIEATQDLFRRIPNLADRIGDSMYKLATAAAAAGIAMGKMLESGIKVQAAHQDLMNDLAKMRGR